MLKSVLILYFFSDLSLGSIHEPNLNFKSVLLSRNGRAVYGNQADYIEQLNNARSTWKATHYEEYEKMSLQTMVRRAGGLKSRVHG